MSHNGKGCRQCAPCYYKINAFHGETHFRRRLCVCRLCLRLSQQLKSAQADFGGMPPLATKAPAVFGSQGPRRPFTGGAACLGLDGQRTAVYHLSNRGHTPNCVALWCAALFTACPSVMRFMVRRIFVVRGF